MNIYQKLIEVRKSCPYLKKDNKGFQFQYVSSSQALGAVRKAMDDHGVLLIPEIVGKEVQEKATKKEGTQIFTELMINFSWVNADAPEEKITCPWYGQGLDSGEKGVGKALTYAEKYFILKFFNIATDKDDPDSFQERIDAQKPPEKISLAQHQNLEAVISKNSLDREAIKQYCAEKFNVEHFPELTSADLRNLMVLIGKKIQKQNNANT